MDLLRNDKTLRYRKNLCNIVIFNDISLAQTYPSAIIQTISKMYGKKKGTIVTLFLYNFIYIKKD